MNNTVDFKAIWTNSITPEWIHLCNGCRIMLTAEATKQYNYTVVVAPTYARPHTAGLGVYAIPAGTKLQRASNGDIHQLTTAQYWLFSIADFPLACTCGHLTHQPKQATRQ